MTLNEQIESIAKRLHQAAEEYQAACKQGDGFAAFEVIGNLRSNMGEMRRLAERCHGSSQKSPFDIQAQVLRSHMGRMYGVDFDVDANEVAANE